MPNRNAIIWAPFNSVANGNYILNTITKQKERINKPELSEDQLSNFNNLIKESLINKTPLEFTIYYNGYTKNIKGTIFKIDNSFQKIYLNTNKIISFYEIINIRKINYISS